MSLQPEPDDIRQQIAQHLQQDDFTGWFETLYASVDDDLDAVPWANLQPHRFFKDWLETNPIDGKGKRALVIGCGLGDDAELLASQAFEVTAFDVSATAIHWCNRRFPDSTVNYQVADLFNPPPLWHNAYDFILEIYTIQALPLHLRDKAIHAISELIAPDGRLLVIGGERPPDAPITGPPWLLSRDELQIFVNQGLIEHRFEQLRNIPNESQFFRVEYRRSEK